MRTQRLEQRKMQAVEATAQQVEVMMQMLKTLTDKVNFITEMLEVRADAKDTQEIGAAADKKPGVGKG